MVDADFELMNSDCCVSELFPNWPHSFKSFSMYLSVAVMCLLDVCGSNLIMFFFSFLFFLGKSMTVNTLVFSKYLLRQFSNYISHQLWFFYFIVSFIKTCCPLLFQIIYNILKRTKQK